MPPCRLDYCNSLLWNRSVVTYTYKLFRTQQLTFWLGTNNMTTSLLCWLHFTGFLSSSGSSLRFYCSLLRPLCTLQKRAIRMVHKAGFQDHTNQLFINSCLLKLPDLVEFQTAQLMYKARNKQLPDNIQKLFTDREGGYDYRGNLNFRTRSVRTTMKRMCTSVSGVKVWNKLSQELKQCPSMSVFMKRLRLMIFNKYRDDGLRWPWMGVCNSSYILVWFFLWFFFSVLLLLFLLFSKFLGFRIPDKFQE